MAVIEQWLSDNWRRICACPYAWQ